MRTRTPTLLLALAVSISSSGCIVVARETYTSLRGAVAVALEPAERFEVSPGRPGHALSQSPSLAHASFGAGSSVTAAVCDWDEGVWFVVFPPLPIPLLSPGDSAGRPGTTVVRLLLDAPGTWRTNPVEHALVGAAGIRSVPDRYKLVTARIDESREPCAAEVMARGSSDGAELAIYGKAELWLSFPTLDWPDSPRTLEVGGLSLDGQPLPSVRLELESGSRWFWYRALP